MSVTQEFIKNAPHITTLNRYEVRYNCPYCDDTKWHLYYNTVKKTFICFKCTKKGKVSIEPSLEDFNLLVSKELEKIKYDDTNTLDHRISFKKTLPLCSPVTTDREATKYLMYRGVTITEMNRFQIKVSTEMSGPYKDTIIFPIANFDTETLEYFVARKYKATSTGAKYINAPWPKDFLYTIHSYEKEVPIIVEGILDAYAVVRAGYTAICLLGKKANNNQLQDFRHGIKEAIIYLDDDALKQALELSSELNALGIKNRIMYDSRDAADFMKESPVTFAGRLNSEITKLRKGEE